MAKTFIIATFAAALANIPAMAHGTMNPGDPAAEPAPVAVTYADLNLGSAAGQAALHQRISHAATEACLNAGDGLSTPRAVYEQRACRARAMSGAEIKLATRGAPMSH